MSYNENENQMILTHLLFWTEMKEIRFGAQNLPHKLNFCTVGSFSREITLIVQGLKRE